MILRMDSNDTAIFVPPCTFLDPSFTPAANFTFSVWGPATSSNLYPSLSYNLPGGLGLFMVAFSLCYGFQPPFTLGGSYRGSCASDADVCSCDPQANSTCSAIGLRKDRKARFINASQLVVQYRSGICPFSASKQPWSAVVILICNPPTPTVQFTAEIINEITKAKDPLAPLCSDPYFDDPCAPCYAIYSTRFCHIFDSNAPDDPNSNNSPAYTPNSINGSFTALPSWAIAILVIFSVLLIVVVATVARGMCTCFVTRSITTTEDGRMQTTLRVMGSVNLRGVAADNIITPVHRE